MERKMILPPTYFLICLIITAGLSILLPVVRIETWLRIPAGFLPIAAGIWLNLAADSIFKRESTTVKPNQKPTKIITEGPFRISRHPMYLGFVSILTGAALVLGGISGLAGAGLMYLILDRKFIPMEEEKMIKVFGDKYQKYKTRVNKWI